MAKIRWNQRQTKELYRDVRAYNAARTRAIRLDPEVERYLPEKLNIQDLKKSIQTRQELAQLTKEVNKELKYKFATIKTADGVIRTVREIEDLKRLARAANAVKRQVAKERGIKPSELGRMGSYAQAQYKPFREDVENIPSSQWAKFRALVESKATKDYYTWEENLYKDNYIETLWRQLGATEETLELVEMIEKIPASQMIKAGLNNNMLKIDFIYANDPSEVDQIRTRLMSLWENYV